MVTDSKYRITGRELIQTIDNWEHLMNFKVNLIGCGGTALTLLEIKDSTKDIDFIVPVGKEYERLMKFLRSLGYEEMEAYLFRCSESPGSYYYQNVSRNAG
jgi:predicted nucleotidyltransferase